MKNYTSIFSHYKTSENIPFLLTNRRIVFPDDMTLDLYGKTYVSADTPWTILSYTLYNTIDYWWILCSLNKSFIFYAEDGKEIYYVKPEYLDLILNSIK